MNADRFNIEGKTLIAESLVKKGDRLLKNDSNRYILAMKYYLDALKVYPDYLISTKIRPFIQSFVNK